MVQKREENDLIDKAKVSCDQFKGSNVDNAAPEFLECQL